MIPGLARCHVNTVNCTCKVKQKEQQRSVNCFLVLLGTNIVALFFYLVGFQFTRHTVKKTKQARSHLKQNRPNGRINFDWSEVSRTGVNPPRISIRFRSGLWLWHWWTFILYFFKPFFTVCEKGPHI